MEVQTMKRVTELAVRSGDIQTPLKKTELAKSD